MALAYQQCLNRTPPLGLCDFGVFAISSVTTANRPSAGAAIGAKGDLTIGTDASPSTIVTTGNLTINSPNGKSITTPGGVWVGGNVSAQNGAGAQYTGTWNVGGWINMNGGNTINGKVYARGDVKNVAIYGDAYSGGTFTSVTGTGARVKNSTHAAPVIELPSSIPKRSLSCASSPSVSVNSGETKTLEPGSYGDVVVQNGNAKLVLKKGGEYKFKSLTLNSGCNNCKLQLGTTAADAAGRWDVSVCGKALLEAPGSSFIAGWDGAKLTKPENLVLYVDSADSSAAARLGTDFKFVGVLIVPNGTFESRDRGTVNGAVWAKKVSSGTDLNATGIDKSVCEALELPGTTPQQPNTCPVNTVVTPPSTVNEYQYAAACPRGTAALWKLLTWETSVPNGSSIVFSAKVGVDAQDLAQKEYQVVGTARPGTPNTTKCDAFNTVGSTCPVRLTEQLSLGTVQGQYLAVRVATETTGGMPAIENFKVSYSCRDDE